jgi:hypothetical protein
MPNEHTAPPLSHLQLAGRDRSRDPDDADWLRPVRPANTGRLYGDAPQQVIGGANPVVATGSGPIELTGLSLLTTDYFFPQVQPNIGLIFTRSGVGGSALPLDFYRTTTGPTNFGSGVDDILTSSGQRGHRRHLG